MNVDQEDEHPWLRRRGRVDARAPRAQACRLLGVCLGGQLLAKAAGAHVGPFAGAGARLHTRGRCRSGAADDPFFGALPREFDVWNVHGYAFHVPEGGVELARSRVCSQAFRLGDRRGACSSTRRSASTRWRSGSREDRVPNGESSWKSCGADRRRGSAFGAALLRSFLGIATKVPARSS